jgi:hypothetical protein
MRFLSALGLLVIASVLAFACASPTAPGDAIDARIVLSPGQTSPIEGAASSIRFQGVLGDSRCPGDAICLQGGDALVRIDVIPSFGASSTYDLHTGSLEPVRHHDLTIELVELTPYPFSSLPPIQPNDYRATLRVTR